MPINIGDHLLGRKPMLFDHRRLYYRLPVTDEMRRLAATITAKEWTMPKILDQGDTPHCVGFAWAGWGLCNPVSDNFTDADGHRIYYEAKVIDGEPNAEDGSFTESGAKAMKNRRRLNAYAWSGSVDDMIVWILTQGPLVVGTNWYSSMFIPDEGGIIRVGGAFRGGHDYLVNGADKATGLFKIPNSWGVSWGIGGFAFLPMDDMRRLQNENGDACTAIENPLQPPNPNPGCIPVSAFLARLSVDRVHAGQKRGKLEFGD